MNFSKLKKNIYTIVGIVAVAVILFGYTAGNNEESSVATVSADVSVTESVPEQAGGEKGEIYSGSSPMSSFESSSSENHGGDGHSQYKNHHWGNPKTLQDHFDRHGGDFGATNPQDYAEKANKFYQDKEKYLVKTDEHGIKRIYDPKTNTFGAYNKNGSTRSFFKPSGDQGYFDRQPGDLEE